jgi:hypothetical protein
MWKDQCSHLRKKTLTALEQDSTIIAVIEMSQSKWLPARQAILHAIGNLLAYGCQLEKFLFAENIFGFFGKVPINHRLVPQVIIPIHVRHCA